MQEKEIKREGLYYDDEIDLAELIKILYKRKKLIIIGVLIFTIFSFIVSLYLPKVYQSEGFYNYNASPGKYKKLQGIVFNNKRFENFISEYVKDKDLYNYLKNFTKSQISFKKSMERFILPVEANPKKRQKLTSNVIGIKIIAQAPKPKLAYNFALILGDYFKNCNEFDYLSKFITDNYFKYLSNVKEVENKIIETKRNIKIIKEKKKPLLALIKNYPQTKDINVSQIISVEKGGFRYLSPVLQVIGLESQLADLYSNLTELKIKKKLTSVYFEFFEKIYNKMDDIKDGDKLFKIINDEFKIYFKDKDLSDEILKEAYNDLSIQINNLKKKFYIDMKFLSGPSIPTKPIKPKKRLIVSVSFVTSLFLFIFLAFFIEWWENNKVKIEEEN